MGGGEGRAAVLLGNPQALSARWRGSALTDGCAVFLLSRKQDKNNLYFQSVAGDFPVSSLPGVFLGSLVSGCGPERTCHCGEAKTKPMDSP